MMLKNKNYILTTACSISLIAIGSIIGLLTKHEISTWYSALNRSSLTPANYVFSIVWPILYVLIGASGRLFYTAKSFKHLNAAEVLFVVQLILNWVWSFVFFSHQIGLSVIILCFMDIAVALLIWLGRAKLKLASILLIPYLLWILFATYLNAYIWLNN